MNAIAAAFPDSRVLLCDFHRQQSWQRWIHSSDVPQPETWPETFGLRHFKWSGH